MRRTFGIFIVAIAIVLSSCTKQSELVGIVQLHQDNRLTILNPIDDTQHTLIVEPSSVEYGEWLPYGTPVVVTYTGRLADGIKAKSVAADKTYVAAVGKWITSSADDATSELGVELMGGGRAVVISGDKALIHSWEPQGEDNTLLLKGRAADGSEVIRAAVISEEQGMLFLTIEDDDNLYRKVL